MMSDSSLKELRCAPCTGKTKSLSELEIKKNLNNLNKWELNDDKNMIFKKYIFKNFKAAVTFLNSVSEIAEFESHHPDISVGWGYCLIMIHTHAIKNLSINDFILAAKIDEIK